MLNALIPCAAGLAAGILSAFGIGGGTLLLLIMTLFLGVADDAARCINLLYFLPTALFSLHCHKKNGYLHSEVIRKAVPPGVALTLPGALLAFFLDTALLRRLFGVYLLCAAVSVFLPKRQKPSETPGG